MLPECCRPAAIDQLDSLWLTRDRITTHLVKQLLPTATMNVVVGGVPQVHRVQCTATLIKAKTSDIKALIRLIMTFLDSCDPDTSSLR